MEGNVTVPEGSTPTSEASEMSFAQRLIGIYTSPQATLEDVNRKGSWLGLFLIMAVLGAALGYLPQTRMDHETYMRKALEMNPMTRNLSEEQVKQIVERPQSAFQRYSTVIFAPLGILLVYVVCAAALLLIFVLMGGGLNFKKSLTMTVWGLVPPGIVGGLLGILFLFVKDPDTLEIDSSANVVSNLGVLVSRKEHAVLHSLLNSIDIFTVWAVFLLAVGFSVASNGKLSRSKAAAGIVALWAIYVAGKLGFTAIFS